MFVSQPTLWISYKLGVGSNSRRVAISAWPSHTLGDDDESLGKILNKRSDGVAFMWVAKYFYSRWWLQK